MTDTPEDNIVSFPGAGEERIVPLTYIKDEEQICTADEVLAPLIGKMENLVVFGWDKDGELLLASSLARMSDVNYMIECVKHRLLAYGSNS